ncbi:MAG: hypothetical protein Q9173_006667 [Seirophora scorigena]
MHDFMYKGGLHDVKHRGVEGAACLAMETPKNANSAEELRPMLATELLVGIPPSETENWGPITERDCRPPTFRPPFLDHLSRLLSASEAARGGNEPAHNASDNHCFALAWVKANRFSGSAKVSISLLTHLPLI